MELNAVAVEDLLGRVSTNLKAVHDGLQEFPSKDEIYFRMLQGTSWKKLGDMASMGGSESPEIEAAVRKVDELVYYLSQGALNRRVYSDASRLLALGIAGDQNRDRIKRQGFSVYTLTSIAAESLKDLKHKPLLRLLERADDTADEADEIASADPNMSSLITASNMLEAVVLGSVISLVVTPPKSEERVRGITGDTQAMLRRRLTSMKQYGPYAMLLGSKKTGSPNWVYTFPGLRDDLRSVLESK